MYTVKQIMMVVHAAPKTHPGGVQGAWFKLVYQSEATPEPVNKPPMANAPKLSSRNKMIRFNIL